MLPKENKLLSNQDTVLNMNVASPYQPLVSFYNNSPVYMLESNSKADNLKYEIIPNKNNLPLAGRDGYVVHQAFNTMPFNNTSGYVKPY